MKHKLGIIVPYRDRYPQLVQFKRHISEYFDNSDIDYELIIVEQDNATAFNRGKLLNIGALEAEKLGCTYLVFHDVDMLPVDVDYSFSEHPTHLASNFISDNKETSVHFDRYFGGVTLFPLNVFKKVNGYSNEYWGWGFEDDDLFNRVIQSNFRTVKHKVPSYVSSTASLRFNGEDSFVSLPNLIDFKNDFSIIIGFNLDPLVLDHKKDVDKQPLFSIAGYDFTVFYDSFKRYNAQIFDKRGKIHTITSDITETKHTKLTVTYASSKGIFSLFLDKTPIGRVRIKEPLYNYGKVKNINLGCSNRQEDAYEPISYFKGTIDTFAIYDGILTNAEITSLVSNTCYGLTSNFDKYKSADKLVTYYDPKFIKDYKLIDLSGNSNDGEIQNCWLDKTNFEQFKVIDIPARRNCLFSLIDHKPGGYLAGRWKDQLTRYNQLKFTNEALPGYRDPKLDGLNTLEFTIHGQTNLDSITHLTVGI